MTHSITVMGTVRATDEAGATFSLRCRSGDELDVYVGPTTQFNVLRNLDGLDRDRVLAPGDELGGDPTGAVRMLRRYVAPDRLLVVEGILHEHEGQRRLEARLVHLLHSVPGRYLFEETHWWLTQITRLADEWLDDLFKDKRTYELDDFAELYRTHLNIIGLPTEQADTDVQEMATLSRLIYGLSSAYLLTGRERYYLAARAGVQYQRETFRMLSHDGRYCFWAFGKRKLRYGSELIEYSLNADDYGTIPLYEQIYALAGMAQYYRITADWEVLADIRRTVRAFNDFYLDSRDKNADFPGTGGYFSHLDYATMRPDHPVLDSDPSHPNRSRKNWNSIGDHIPAYLVNLILSLDPLPVGRTDLESVREFLAECQEMLDITSTLIVEKFPDSDKGTPYLNERFHADWTPDHAWGWQQNRAVVGHNLKVAWNLTRVANYYRGRAKEDDVARFMELANELARRMGELGIDQIRGGCFDAVEREPSNGMPVEFAWGNTKDFWQQEQAILAYLILHGYTGDESYLQLARECMAFWNLYFLDHDNRGIFFRVNDDGNPVLQGQFADKASHSVAGYHSFELNFLAHIYVRLFVQTGRGGDNEFCLFFKPDRGSGQRSINVLPDFLDQNSVEIREVAVNGVKKSELPRDGFQLTLGEHELGSTISVVLGRKAGAGRG